MTHRYLRPAVPKDVEFLASRLRDADRRELQATGSTPLDALKMGLRWSVEPVTLVPPTGVPVGMAGVVRASEKAGAIWMLATDELVSHQIAFLRSSKEWVEEQNKKFPILFNAVDERNVVHIKWLKWLGFVFIQRHPLYGVEQRPFIEFIRIAHV